ncbi:MAG: C-type lectin domain-containing protein [Deltaproteobacteria bacterium]|nr:C-type lectin domain-containing protein [Deltaproteobacteria bacterium]
MLVDAGGRDSATDTASGGCPVGCVDLDGEPGCECEVRPEECNSFDDDCDVSVDEEAGVACGTPGTCSQGERACVAGSLESCMPTTAPPPETCGNMLDDDCDMAIDEDCACAPVSGTQPCGNATGECRQGTQTCEAEGWASCEGSVGPGTETCNGLDDDCDGSIDGMTRPCSSDIGICRAGMATCTSGMFGGCSGVLPGVEICDAERLDEDCNGVPNNGCACDEGDTQPCGSCGTQTCNSRGAFGMCSEMVGTETCNGLDDDCDGTTDEDTTCGACQQANNGTRSYLFCIDITRNWADARAYCMTYGYDLATVEDAAENAWLNDQERSRHMNNVRWWYGGSDAATEGTWVWAPTMMTVGYAGWKPDGEPDNGTSENCLSSENRRNAEWRSDDCTADYVFVCEDQDS